MTSLLSSGSQVRVLPGAPNGRSEHKSITPGRTDSDGWSTNGPLTGGIPGNSRLRWWWATASSRVTEVWPTVVLIADVIICAVLAVLAGVAAAAVGVGIFLGLHDQQGHTTWLSAAFLLAYTVAATVALLVWATRASKRWDR